MSVGDCLRFIVRTGISAGCDSRGNSPTETWQSRLDAGCLQVGRARDFCLRQIQAGIIDGESFSRMEWRVRDVMQDRRAVVTRGARAHHPVEADFGFDGSVA